MSNIRQPVFNDLINIHSKWNKCVTSRSDIDSDSKTILIHVMMTLYQSKTEPQMPWTQCHNNGNSALLIIMKDNSIDQNKQALIRIASTN